MRVWVGVGVVIIVCLVFGGVLCDVMLGACLFVC